MSQLRKSTLAGVLAGLLFAAVASARNDAGGWRHTVVLYGMGAAIDGTAQIADLEVLVDVSISELFDSLEMGAMGAWRMENGTWSVMADATYMGLGATSRTEGGRVKGDFDLDQTTLMATVGRRFADHFELLFGAAYFDLGTRLQVSGPLAVREAEAGVDWVDPTVGLGFHRPLGASWRLNLRGDVGGFGVGSNLLVHLLANVRWQTSGKVGIVFGYRYIAFDYEEGDGLDYQRYDLAEQGPLVGVAFSF